MDSMASLTSTYLKQERLEKAEELKVKAIKTEKRLRGKKLWITLEYGESSQDMLATRSLEQDHAVEGVISGDPKRGLKEKHSDTLIVMANLISTYLKQGRWVRAEKLQRKVLEILKRVLGQKYPEAFNMHNLASTYETQRRIKEAAELEVKAMERPRRMLGDVNADTLATMPTLVSVYRKQGHLDQAGKLETILTKTRRRVLCYSAVSRRLCWSLFSERFLSVPTGIAAGLIFYQF